MTDTAFESDRYLVELRGPEDFYRSTTVNTDRITIGRSSSNQVQIPDGSVSRHHTEVARDDDGRWWVIDLGSQNGTYVDGERVEGKMVIDQGDPIQIEGFILRIRPADDARSLTMYETRSDAIRPLGRVALPRITGEQLNALIDLGERFIHQHDDAERQAHLCRVMISDTLGGMYAAVLRCEVSDAGLDSVAVLHKASRDAGPSAEHISRTLLNHVLAHRQPAYATQSGDSGVQMTVIDPKRKQAAIVCPIVIDETGMTVLYVNFPAELGGEDWLSLAHLAVDQYRRAVAVWELRVKEQRQAVAENELRRARQIQLAQVPSEVVMPGLEVVVDFQANPSVGGGYMDVARLSDGRALVFLAAASGKGLEAALFTVSLHTYVNTQVEGYVDLREFMGRLNRFMCQNLPSGAFIAAIGMIIDPQSGQIEHVNFGHTPPWIIDRKNPPVQLPMDQLPPLGMEVEAEPVVHVAQLEPDQLLAAVSRSLLGDDSDTGQVLSRIWQDAAQPDVYDSADKLLSVIKAPGDRVDDTGDIYLMLMERATD
ncbi:MAG: SpoIIE family protein phosphatase [Phycisphaera sp.]|nr:SpoIIE family protein phosphatase [Phycisphaera sp.]